MHIRLTPQIATLISSSLPHTATHCTTLHSWWNTPQHTRPPRLLPTVTTIPYILLYHILLHQTTTHCTQPATHRNTQKHTVTHPSSCVKTHSCCTYTCVHTVRYAYTSQTHAYILESIPNQESVWQLCHQKRLSLSRALSLSLSLCLLSLSLYLTRISSAPTRI